MDQLNDNDSGMASLSDGEVSKTKNTDEWDSDEEEDESVAERLLALGEMFPDSVRDGAHKLFTGSIDAIKSLYNIGCSASWIFFSTSVILFAPVLFEAERTQTEEIQKQQQRQILLGPNAAVSGNPGPPPFMPMQSPSR